MTRFPNLRQTSSWAVFNQVGSLLQEVVGVDAIVQTEADFPRLHGRFVLVVSSDFSALLLGSLINTEQCSLELTFSPDAIADFCRVIDRAPDFELKENQSDRQSEFTLKLIELLSQSPIESAHQIEQERLLSQLTTLIRHSLNLPVILETAVHQVRDFLQADRLIIYQFNFPAPSCAIDHDLSSFREVTHNLDGITYESRSSDQIPSILNVVSEYISPKQLQTRPQESQTWTNGRKSSEASTMTSLLKQSPNDVQAELVTPIVVQEELWGLLIVHQCQSPRQWNDREKILLQRIAEHLAIAIYQAKLYSELQQQKSTLEQQIIDRTQDLRDTLIAAQSANRTKSEFLATMSHELRSPLTTIIGMASTLLRSLETNYKIAPQKQQEYLQTIQERGEHLLALINDILDLSEVEAGRMFLRIQKFSLAELVEQTIQMLQEKADSKQVALILELLPDRSQNFTFQADPQRVQQICLNLLSNAIKFTPAQGRVIMRVRVSGETAILQVEDTGIGIPNHQRSFLFQKFQQLDASYHRKYEGTGLGLALTKQLVELHGGSIEVDSTVGVGSKFTVFLPTQTISAIEHARQD
ncbi:sensor histidine kinase [Leptolyngbya sp. NIES-2104]|uniref:sensor histidine kinase n=1 Tax=Leptolyngbya sp. NIES-2104 TaxID=1552121 RepID=UPI0006EC8A58|nr:ATP-binding protein [Leptolyngbya sp. NIES-2104]GAP97171.1 circadian input kinase A [Leptolyngbya sp. NIES-2104]